MSAFLKWLAPQLDEVRASMPGQISTIASELTSEGTHARTPRTSAELIFALNLFFRFAAEAGAISADDQERLKFEASISIAEEADAQREFQEANEPTNHFVRLLVAVLSSSRGHVAGPDGDFPTEETCKVTNARAWGWRRLGDAVTHSGGLIGIESQWQPQGRRIGWISEDGKTLYLEQEGSYATCQALANEQGMPIGTSQHSLAKRLQENGFLTETDVARNRIPVRKMLEGRRRYVLALNAEKINPEEREPGEDG